VIECCKPEIYDDKDLGSNGISNDELKIDIFEYFPERTVAMDGRCNQSLVERLIKLSGLSGS
jgi:hypothetical protein